MSEEQNINVNVDLEDASNAIDDLNKNMSDNKENAPRENREGYAPRENRDGTRPPMNRNFRPGGKKKSFFAKKVCKFTTGQMDPATIDYKNIELLKRFIMSTGTCSKYQRVLAREIKKARIMAFLPFSAR